MAYNLGRNSKTKGVMRTGPKNQQTRVSERDGELMKVASKKVISTHPSNTIKNAASMMRDDDVRRLPVIHAGTGKLEGLLTAVDILDFMGGGPKYNIIESDYRGNFLAAVNCHVQKIMREAQYLPKSASVDDAIRLMLEKRSSCIPVVASEKELTVVGLVTERDVLPMIDPDGMGVKVGDIMKRDLITASPGMMISDVSKVMVRNQLRRLPVILEDKLVGVVTSLDVLGYLHDGHFKGADAEINLSTRVQEIMQETVTTVGPEDDVNEVIRLVKETGFGGFPVSTDGRLAGIITISDIFHWIYENG
ncbi:MAG: CBS domain-containing protein [Candidatus Altiarchaeota archaeon]